MLGNFPSEPTRDDGAEEDGLPDNGRRREPTGARSASCRMKMTQKMDSHLMPIRHLTGSTETGDMMKIVVAHGVEMVEEAIAMMREVAPVVIPRDGSEEALLTE